MSLVNATPPLSSLATNVPHLPLTKNANVSSQDHGWMPPPQRSRGRPKRTNDQGKGMILIVVGVIVAIAFLANQKSASRKSMQLKDDATFEEQIEDTNQQNERQQQEIMSKGKDTQQYSEAQAFYLRGFREFREGNYGRAILNFEAALALYPNHPLAKRYLDRARIKDNELITQALERGEKDFQLQKYTHAFNEYRTVILLTNEPKNKYYQLAQKRIEAINLILMNNR
jgi:tetratricopeptide (TPR) repeat protein